jgi:hypothetical protein
MRFPPPPPPETKWFARGAAPRKSTISADSLAESAKTNMARKFLSRTTCERQKQIAFGFLPPARLEALSPEMPSSCCLALKLRSRVVRFRCVPFPGKRSLSVLNDAAAPAGRVDYCCRNRLALSLINPFRCPSMSFPWASSNSGLQ